MRVTPHRGQEPFEPELSRVHPRSVRAPGDEHDVLLDERRQLGRLREPVGAGQRIDEAERAGGEAPGEDHEGAVLKPSDARRRQRGEAAAVAALDGARLEPEALGRAQDLTRFRGAVAQGQISLDRRRIGGDAIEAGDAAQRAQAGIERNGGRFLGCDVLVHREQVHAARIFRQSLSMKADITAATARSLVSMISYRK